MDLALFRKPYLGTWSAVQAAHLAGHDPLPALQAALTERWPQAGAMALTVRWPFMGRWGLVHRTE